MKIGWEVRMDIGGVLLRQGINCHHSIHFLLDLDKNHRHYLQNHLVLGRTHHHRLDSGIIQIQEEKENISPAQEETEDIIHIQTEKEGIIRIQAVMVSSTQDQMILEVMTVVFIQIQEKMNGMMAVYSLAKEDAPDIHTHLPTDFHLALAHQKIHWKKIWLHLPNTMVSMMLTMLWKKILKKT
jgi:hypothetical protein